MALSHCMAWVGCAGVPAKCKWPFVDQDFATYTIRAPTHTIGLLHTQSELLHIQSGCYMYKQSCYICNESLHGTGRHQWAQLLTRLQLTPEQQQKLLTARQCLLSGLAKIGKKRSEIIGRLGLQALECPGVRFRPMPCTFPTWSRLVATSYVPILSHTVTWNALDRCPLLLKQPTGQIATKRDASS